MAARARPQQAAAPAAAAMGGGAGVGGRASAGGRAATPRRRRAAARAARGRGPRTLVQTEGARRSWVAEPGRRPRRERRPAGERGRGSAGRRRSRSRRRSATRGCRLRRPLRPPSRLRAAPGAASPRRPRYPSPWRSARSSSANCHARGARSAGCRDAGSAAAALGRLSEVVSPSLESARPAGAALVGGSLVAAGCPPFAFPRRRGARRRQHLRRWRRGEPRAAGGRRQP